MYALSLYILMKCKQPGYLLCDDQVDKCNNCKRNVNLYLLMYLLILFVFFENISAFNVMFRPTA